MVDRAILATRRRRGRQTCHLDGRFQKSVFGGDQMGGGVSGSVLCSDSRPISERLPKVNRLVMEPGVVTATWIEEEDERKTFVWL
jgi:hypothetical protein